MQIDPTRISVQRCNVAVKRVRPVFVQVFWLCEVRTRLGSKWGNNSSISICYSVCLSRLYTLDLNIRWAKRMSRRFSQKSIYEFNDLLAWSLMSALPFFLFFLHVYFWSSFGNWSLQGDLNNVADKSVLPNRCCTCQWMSWAHFCQRWSVRKKRRKRARKIKQTFPWDSINPMPSTWITPPERRAKKAEKEFKVVRTMRVLLGL